MLQPLIARFDETAALIMAVFRLFLYVFAN
jgi:hypothetical protein